MGTSFDNCQVHADSVEGVNTVLESLGITAFLSDIENGWISVYPHDSVSAWEVACQLSENLNTLSIYLYQVDSDVDGYALFDKGKAMDEYISYLEYGLDPDEDDIESIITPEIRARYAGNPQAILPFCRPNTTETAICEALSDIYYPDKLCNLLGLSWERCVLAYRFVERGEATFSYTKVVGREG